MNQTLAITPMELVSERILSSLDMSYYNGLYRQLRYAFGFSWNTETQYASTNGRLPDFPPLDVSAVDVGSFRGVFVNQFIALVKNMFSTPKPVFPDLDEVFDELRRQFFLQQWNEGAWSEAVSAAFLDGHGTGSGYVRVGLRPNADGTMSTDMRYLSPLDCLWDPFEQDFRKARWAACLIDMPVDEAMKAFPAHAEQIKDSATVKHMTADTCVKRVRLLEYWDKQTYRVFYGESFNSEHMCCEMPNPFKRIPIAAMQYLIVPKAKRAIGTILLQLSAAEELRSLHKYIRNMAYEMPLDIVDYGQVDVKQMEQAQKGNRRTVKRKSGTDLNNTPAVQRIEPRQLNETAFKWKQMMDDEFTRTGNYNAYDQNTVPEGIQTKYEAQIYRASTAGLGGWAQKQALIFVADLVDIALTVARVGHTAPGELDYEGHSWFYNNPQDPDSALSHMLEKPSRALIDQTSLRFSDAMTDMQNQVHQLELLFPGVEAGLIRADKYYEEMLQATGRTDPESWLVQQTVQGMEGMPMQGMGPGAPANSLQPQGDPSLMQQTPAA